MQNRHRLLPPLAHCRRACRHGRARSSPFPGPPGPPCPRPPSSPSLGTLCGQRRPSPLALTPLSPVSPPRMNGRRRPKLAQLAAPRHAILYAANPSPRPDPPRHRAPASPALWTPLDRDHRAPPSRLFKLEPHLAFSPRPTASPLLHHTHHHSPVHHHEGGAAAASSLLLVPVLDSPR